MNHSTKWNRVTVNKPLEARLYNARAKYLNDYDQIAGKVALGISHTCQPDGSVVKR